MGRLARARRMTAIMVGYGFAAAPGWMAGTVVVMAMAAVLSVLAPVGYRLMVDAYLAHNHTRMVVGVIVVATLSAGTWVLTMLASSQANGLVDRVNLYLSCRIATLVTDIPGLEHFERPDYLQELDLLNDNARLLAAAPRQALAACQVVLRTGVIVVLLATVYPPLAVLPLFGIAGFLGDHRSVRLREQADESTVEQRRLAAELFALASTAAPAKELRTFGLQAEIAKRHEHTTRHVRTATIRAAIAGAGWSSLGWLAYGVGFGGAIALLVVRAVHHQVSVGEVVMAVGLVRRAQQQVSQASDAVGQLVVSARPARRLMWLEDHSGVAGAALAATAEVPDRLTHGITLDSVTFTYPGTTKAVVTDLNLHLPAGSVVAIVGDNGAGKTTLVKLLTGMYRPSAGAILVEGTDLAHLDINQWRARISAIFQDFVCFSLRAGETVGVGDLPRIDNADAIATALTRADALAVIDALPDGMRTPLGWSFGNGRDLSGGQWQKLALGRGMMRDTPLLLVLDEPTANLDAPTEATLYERYANAAHRAGAEAGGITILVSHRFSTVRMADLIVVIQDGRIAEVGDHPTLLEAGGVYAELYELQARSYRAG